jgi:hypothetical protein
MLKNIAKKIISRSLNLEQQKRVAGALEYNMLSNASKHDLSFLEDLFASMELFQRALEDRIRKIRFSGRSIPENPATWRGRSALRTWVMEDSAPWMTERVQPVTMPGMISDEEAQYYEYIGKLYEGQGEVIELGPWLGKSTKYIIRGLIKNQSFAGKTLHVFDDFVWRTSWMDPYLPEKERLPNHANFRPLFEKFMHDELPLLNVTRARIADYDGNETLPRISWDHNKIEMIYIDCGRTVQANEGWFEVLSPNLISDVSLLIMQDWRLHRERPRRFYNQTNLFTAAHPELELIHEVQQGGLATFLFRGNRGG